jgi:hypothetical protein
LGKMSTKDDEARRNRIGTLTRVTRADRKTVAKALEGKPVRGAAGHALEAEIKRRGWR